MATYPKIEYTGANAVKQGDAWAETLTVSKTDADSVAVALTVPTRARIALYLYTDEERTGNAVLRLDSTAGADGTITLAQSGNNYTVAWSHALSLAVGKYRGDLRLEWSGGSDPTPNTPVDIFLEVVTGYAGQ